MSYGSTTYCGTYYKYETETKAFIKLSAGVDYCFLPMPQWGYQSIIKMAMSITESNTSFKIRDNGSQYDYRLCKIPVMFLDPITAKEFSDFMRDKNSGRDNQITIEIDTVSGFFPFGADISSSGQFVVNLLNYNMSDRLYAPFDHFKLSLEMKLLSWNTTEIIDEVSQGEFEFGNVDGLMLPQNGSTIDFEYGVNNVLSLSGDCGSVDSKFEKTTLEFDLKCNTGKCAKILDEIVSNIRSNSFTINGGNNSYLFGINNNKSGAHTCKLIQNTIEVTHEEYNQFTMPIKLWKVVS